MIADLRGSVFEHHRRRFPVERPPDLVPAYRVLGPDVQPARVPREADVSSLVSGHIPHGDDLRGRVAPVPVALDALRVDVGIVVGAAVIEPAG